LLISVSDKPIAASLLLSNNNPRMSYYIARRFAFQNKRTLIICTVGSWFRFFEVFRVLGGEKGARLERPLAQSGGTTCAEIIVSNLNPSQWKQVFNHSENNQQ
jgi:hypothetical protein